MTDIVEWLRGEVPHCDDPSNYDEWELRMLEAADEIERLREAANDLAQYVSRADWYHYVKPETRAALGEGK